MKKEPLFIYKQNLPFTLGVLILYIFVLLGLLYFTSILNYPIVLVSVVAFMVLHIWRRSRYWEFAFYMDRLMISRSFGNLFSQKKNLKLSEIERVHIRFILRFVITISVYTKDGERYTALLDKKKLFSPQLITQYMANEIQFSGNGGGWST